MSLLIQYVMWYNLLIIPYFCKIDSMWLKVMFYHSLRLKQTECICMYFTVERLQHLCKVLHIICSLWTLIFFLGIETFKIVESLHHYHDKSLRQDEFVRNSAKTNEKRYTIPDSKRGFFFKHGSNNTFWQTSKCIHYDRLGVNSLPIVVNINEKSQQLSYTKTWHIGTTAG